MSTAPPAFPRNHLQIHDARWYWSDCRRNGYQATEFMQHRIACAVENSGILGLHGELPRPNEPTQPGGFPRFYNGHPHAGGLLDTETVDLTLRIYEHWVQTELPKPKVGGLTSILNMERTNGAYTNPLRDIALDGNKPENARAAVAMLDARAAARGTTREIENQRVVDAWSDLLIGMRKILDAHGYQLALYDTGLIDPVHGNLTAVRTVPLYSRHSHGRYNATDFESIEGQARSCIQAAQSANQSVLFIVYPVAVSPHKLKGRIIDRAELMRTHATGEAIAQDFGVRVDWSIWAGRNETEYERTETVAKYWTESIGGIIGPLREEPNHHQSAGRNYRRLRDKPEKQLREAATMMAPRNAEVNPKTQPIDAALDTKGNANGNSKPSS